MGRFVFNISASDADGRWWIIELQHDAPGLAWGQLSLRVPADAGIIDVGDVPIWDANFSGSQTDTGVDLSWSPRPSGLPPASDYRILVETNSGPLTGGTTAETSWHLDGRMIQDDSVRASAVVSIVHAGDPSWQEFLLAGPISVTGSSVPPSRGASCIIDGATFAAGECRVTDGTVTSSPPAVASEIVVDLGETKTITAVSWNDFDLFDQEATFTIAASSDCVAFTDVDTGAMQDGAVVRDLAPTSTRCVRFTFSRPIEMVAEIGLW